METKTARLTILIDPAKKKAFEGLCAALDVTPSQVVRQLIREYLAGHGVSYSTQSAIRRARGTQPRADRRPRRRRAKAGATVHR
ncbi:MAG: CopG family transcriptional regulator [Burkholderiales bacterium]|nr:CopG family transcriptional regulator [Burkholderiales bacterium]